MPRKLSYFGVINPTGKESDKFLIRLTTEQAEALKNYAIEKACDECFVYLKVEK